MKRFLLLHIALVVLVTAAWFPTALQVDDAFITFRYASNVAAGHGLVYNPGEPHLGTTTPLFGMLLGVVAALGGTSAIGAAVVLQFLAAVALLVACVGIFWARPLGALAALVPWVVLADPIVRATTGMESVAFLAVCAWGILAFRRDRLFLAGLLAGLACLVRPDGILLCAVLFAAAWRSRRRFPGWLVVGGALVGLAWCAYAIPTYGSPIPATVGAKVGQAKSGIWQDPYGRVLLFQWIPGGPTWLWGLAGLGALVAIWRRGALGLALTAWIVVHQGAYVLVGVPAYPWYYTAFLGQAALLAAYAVTSVPRELGFGTSVGLKRVGALAATTVALAWLAGSLASLDGIRQRLRTDALAPKHPYVEFGRWMRERSSPDAKLAAVEVGILGYYSERRISDLLGLVTPDVARRVPNQQHTAYVMRTHRPDYAMAFASFTAQEADLEQYLIRGYDPVLAAGGRVLYRRRPIDEGGLAERVAAALPDVEGRVLFGDFPAALDFDRFRTAFAGRRPKLTMVRWSQGDEGAAIQLDPSGAVVVVPRLEAMHATAEGLREWPRSGHVKLDDAAAAGAPRFRTTESYAFIHTPSAPGSGPFRRVRLRMTVHESRGRSGASGRVWWNVAGTGRLRAEGWTAFVIPRFREPVDVVVHLPQGGVSAEQTLSLLRIDLLDLPGEITVHGVWLDRV